MGPSRCITEVGEREFQPVGRDRAHDGEIEPLPQRQVLREVGALIP
jgi:hypothetical protein